MFYTHRCEEPFGQLLTHAAQQMRSPMIEFCTDLTTRVEVRFHIECCSCPPLFIPIIRDASVSKMTLYWFLSFLSFSNNPSRNTLVCDTLRSGYSIHRTAHSRNVSVFMRFVRCCTQVVAKHPLESTTSTRSFTTEDITQAMEEPFMQVQRYPHFVNSVMRACEFELTANVALDLQMMRDARDYMHHTVVLVMKVSCAWR